MESCCQQCKGSFDIADEDLRFYEKISRYYKQIPETNPDGPYEYFIKISSYGKSDTKELENEPKGPWRCYTGDQELLTMATTG